MKSIKEEITNNATEILFKVGPNGTLPTRGSELAAGFDLYAAEDVTFTPSNIDVRHDHAIVGGEAYTLVDGFDDIDYDRVTIARVSTDVCVAIPHGYVGQVWDRSSLHKRQMKIAGGVIDQDYRGEIFCIVMYWGAEPITVKKGERLGQLIVVPYISAHRQVDTLDETKRGENGLGSTGL